MAAAAVTGQYRRGKTALFLIACVWAGAAPHWLEPSNRLLLSITLVCLLGGYGFRTVFLRDRDKKLINSNVAASKSLVPIDIYPPILAAIIFLLLIYKISDNTCI